jgi:hypothetical protein
MVWFNAGRANAEEIRARMAGTANNMVDGGVDKY